MRKYILHIALFVCALASAQRYETKTNPITGKLDLVWKPSSIATIAKDSTKIANAPTLSSIADTTLISVATGTTTQKGTASQVKAYINKDTVSRRTIITRKTTDSLNTVQTTNIINQVVLGQYLTYQNSRGTSELLSVGSVAYQGVCMYWQLPATTTFNMIRVAMGNYNVNPGSFTFRIYTASIPAPGAGFYPTAAYLTGLTLLETQTFASGEHTIGTSTVVDYKLNNTYTVSANSYIYVFCHRAIGSAGTTTCITQRFTSQVGTPLRTNICYSVSTSNNAFETWGFAVAGATYLSAGAELYVQNSTILDPKIVIPATIYAVKNHELNIWKDALSAIPTSINQLYIDCVSDSGYNKARGYRFTPVDTNTRGIPVYIKAYDANKNLISNTPTTLKVYRKNNGSGRAKILSIGNSLTSNGYWVNEIDTMIDTDGGITPIWQGTKGTAPKKHEGIAGWRTTDFSTDQFSTVVNPFYFHTFTVSAANASVGSVYRAANGSDFIVKTTIAGTTTLLTQRYNSTTVSGTSGTLTKQSGTGDATITYTNRVGAFSMKNYTSVNSLPDTIDYVFVELGINDCFWSGYSVTGSMTNLKTIIDYINNATTGYPNAKIIIGLPTISCLDLNGYSANYYANTSMIGYSTNIRLYWQYLISNFETTVYSPNVRLAIPGLMVDRYFGYPRTTVAVSARNTAGVEEFTNAVHPEASGYLQIADAFYYVLRSFLGL